MRRTLEHMCSNAIAREDCSVYSIRYDVLEGAIAKDHSLAIAMMKIYTLHMRRQQAKYRDLLFTARREHSILPCCA